MILNFSKYHGAGNDFILIDNRKGEYNLSSSEIALLCKQHTGIGADGLMFLNQSSSCDFEMRYYNSDGNESTMCGNGGRCITAFAADVGIIDKTAHFVAIDGLHQAEIINNEGFIKNIRLKMSDVDNVQLFGNYFVLNTGSPHYVQFIDDVQSIDLVTEGRRIRYDHCFTPEGINVNFAQIYENHLYVRTYERGVEDETLSCGTGVTASAIAYALDKNIQLVNIETKGGKLNVSFTKNINKSFSEIYLEGEACLVFKGETEI
ncbi:MAG: diaminopimelate epimerase [Bacteroidetes bacterium]|nr:diaminopimelate epimerase [Bacteroidota bacterium]